MAVKEASIRHEPLRAPRLVRVASVPPLENGDRLTRAEFERRYEAMPHVKKAELIEGVVYLGTPVNVPHSECHADIIGWLGNYRVATPGVACGDNGTVRIDEDNEPQPDVSLRIKIGGASRVSKDQYLEGAPELIAEVAMSSASYDLNDKLQTYRRNGVKEYIVWQLIERKLTWFRLQEGEYVAVKPDKKGVIESSVFPGLRLHVKALLADKMADVMAELQKGIASPEHAAFVAQLAGKKRKSSKPRRGPGRGSKTKG
ncbi:MAG: Uma2 family endonuclease [Blastocatellia bacterium]